jgi:hypothetical protein
MPEFNTFVSPDYPVLRSVKPVGGPGDPGFTGQATLSLALLVKGIPSFLATIPVRPSDLDALVSSLDSGNVRVAVAGVSVDETALREDDTVPREPWRAENPVHSLPAAFLSLVCANGRQIGVARIVSREESASPDEVAHFVLSQIARGVQIPDLASTP